MSKKKEPCSNDALITLKSVLGRSLLTDYIHVNAIMISKSSKGNSVMIVPEDTLWQEIINDEEMKSHVKELDLNDPDDTQYTRMFQYGENMNSPEWIELPAEEIHKGKIININIEGFAYDIPISRALIPLKLKKSEACDIGYRIIEDSDQYILLVRKKFTYPLDGCSFYICTMYKIL